MSDRPVTDFEEIREIARVLEAMWPDDHRSASYVKALGDKLARIEEQLASRPDWPTEIHAAYLEKLEELSDANLKIDHLVEQLETAHAATEDTALAANLFREQRDRLQEQLEAALRVVDSARIAYDGFGEDDHQFYGSQISLASALRGYDERYPASGHPVYDENYKIVDWNPARES